MKVHELLSILQKLDRDVEIKIQHNEKVNMDKFSHTLHICKDIIYIDTWWEK